MSGFWQERSQETLTYSGIDRGVRVVTLPQDHSVSRRTVCRLMAGPMSSGQKVKWNLKRLLSEPFYHLQLEWPQPSV